MSLDLETGQTANSTKAAVSLLGAAGLFVSVSNSDPNQSSNTANGQASDNASSQNVFQFGVETSATLPTGLRVRTKNAARTYLSVPF